MFLMLNHVVTPFLVRLLAIMLGRLRMTTDDAINHYSNLFEIPPTKKSGAPYKAGALNAKTMENKIGDLVQAKALGDMMIEQDGENNPSTDEGTGRGCRALVCAMPASSSMYPKRIRTYAVGEEAYADCAIWQAAQATTAGTAVFSPLAVSSAPQELTGGGSGFRNPVHEVLVEARAVFGGEAKLGCLVSIGAGQFDVIEHSKSGLSKRSPPAAAASALKHLVTASEAGPRGGEGVVEAYAKGKEAEPPGMALEERVYKKPRKMVRWHCHVCHTLFVRGSKQCGSYYHERCRDCHRVS
jgi:hypothetical protein